MERWSPGSGRRLKVEFVFVLTFRDNSSFGLNSLGGSVDNVCFNNINGGESPLEIFHMKIF